MKQNHVDLSRVLGELEEFKRASILELHEIKSQIKELSVFKWKVAGGMAAFMAAVEVAHLFIGIK